MSTTTFLLVLVCLLVSVKIAGWIFQYLRFPVVIGQLLVGIVAGPSVLGWVHPNQLLEVFSTIGAILLMFIAGLETDMKQMRAVGGAAFTAASLGVIVSFGAGSAFAIMVGYPIAVSLFFGAMLTATSIGISAGALKSMGKLNTKAGTTILGAAVIDDVLGLIMVSVILAVTLGQNPTWAILKMVLYFPVAYIIGHYGFPLLSRRLPHTLALETRLGLVLALVLLYAWSAESLGNVATITGAYIAGILVNRTDMRDWVHDGLSKVGYSLFVPLFFASIGIAASFQTVTQVPFFLLLGFVLIAILSKILGCASGAFIWRFKAHDAWTVGFGMITRGEVVLIAAAIGLQAHLLTPALFSITILIILITTMLSPVLLKLLYSLQPVSPPHSEPMAEPLDDRVEQMMSPTDAILIEEKGHV
jgi:Kef-type K+ transport system membrane component KefB